MFFWWSVALAVTAGTVPPELEKAETLVASYKYAEAKSALARARAVKGLERPALLRTLELTGIVNGQLRLADKAEAAFRELLVLDPTHALGAEYAPRVMTPFFAARQWVAEQGALGFTAAAPELSATSVTAVVVEVKDPTAVGRAVRFHLRRGTEWAVTTTTVTQGKARLSVELPEASWWAELRGANGEQLALVGSEASPLVVRPPTQAKASEPPPKVVPDEPRVVTLPAAPVTRSSGTRTSSYFFLGGAVIAGVVGGIFGYESTQGFAKFKDGIDNPNGLTERQVSKYGTDAAFQGTLANALFAASGVLAVTAVVLWLVGAPVIVTPAPGGVALAVAW